MMNRNAACILGFLIPYLILLIVAMGCGAAAYNVFILPHPGAWWPVLLGLPAFLLGMQYTKSFNNDCLRVTFIIIGSFAVILAVIGGIVDSASSSLASAPNTCFPYNDNSVVGKQNCCVARQETMIADLFVCAAAEHDTNTCLCCYYDNADSSQTTAYSWKIHGSCDQLTGNLSGVLAASATFNFISALLMIFALAISCCRCCGPLDINPQQQNSGQVVIATVVTATPASNY
eukprot:c8035_g1_i1.p1 GENE.c8035_g1_i1~~c8035_g1_i1.p1  ORF type:complete len:232 (-),score=39.55 c8035_g1_i1:170-865(-)